METILLDCHGGWMADLNIHDAGGDLDQLGALRSI